MAGAPHRRLRAAEHIYEGVELSEELEDLPVQVVLDVFIDVQTVGVNDVVALAAKPRKPQKRS